MHSIESEIFGSNVPENYSSISSQSLQMMKQMIGRPSSQQPATQNEASISSEALEHSAALLASLQSLKIPIVNPSSSLGTFSVAGLALMKGPNEPLNFPPNTTQVKGSLDSVTNKHPLILGKSSHAHPAKQINLPIQTNSAQPAGKRAVQPSQRVNASSSQNTAPPQRRNSSSSQRRNQSSTHAMPSSGAAFEYLREHNSREQFTGPSKPDANRLPSFNELTTEFVNKKNSNAHAILYQNLKLACKNCGLRFKDNPSERQKLSVHLDWHFKRNRRLRDKLKRPISRDWFPNEQVFLDGLFYFVGMDNKYFIVGRIN